MPPLPPAGSWSGVLMLAVVVAVARQATGSARRDESRRVQSNHLIIFCAVAGNPLSDLVRSPRPHMQNISSQNVGEQGNILRDVVSNVYINALASLHDEFESRNRCFHDFL